MIRQFLYRVNNFFIFSGENGIFPTAAKNNPVLDFSGSVPII